MFRKLYKGVVSIPAILFGVAGLLLTMIGLGFVTVGKYLFMLIDDT